MAELSPVEAALFAFKKRDKRLVLTRAALGYLAARALVAIAFLALAWPLLQPVVTWYVDTIRSVMAGGEMPAPPLQSFAALAPVVLASGLVSMTVLAAFEAACLRWMLRGEVRGPLVLNFGADTWRVLAVYLLWFVAGIVCFAAIIAVYATLRVLSGLHPAIGVVTLLLGALAPLAIAGCAIWFAVRLAPAAACSVAAQRLTFFGAWRATRGIFWPLLGGFVIVFVAYLIAATITGALLRLPFAYALEPVWRDVVLNGADPGALLEALSATFSQPTYMAFGALYVAVTVALACVFYIASYGVNACAVLASQKERTGMSNAAPSA